MRIARQMDVLSRHPAAGIRHIGIMLPRGIHGGVAEHVSDKINISCFII